MPVSMNLPFSICYPVTRLARRFRRSPIAKESDQTHYFEWQHADTGQRHVDHMEGLRIQGKTVLDIGSGLGGRAWDSLSLGPPESSTSTLTAKS